MFYQEFLLEAQDYQKAGFPKSGFPESRLPVGPDPQKQDSQKAEKRQSSYENSRENHRTIIGQSYENNMKNVVLLRFFGICWLMID